jgi:hypothetical protein
MAILPAVKADDLVDKLGVNVHAAFGAPGRAGATYSYNQPGWTRLVPWLGLRHVRDQMWSPSVTGASGTAILNAAIEFQDAGIGVLRSITGPAKLAELMNGEVPPPEAVETYNELDQDPAHLGTWATDIASFQPTLYNTVKAAWPNVPVLGPSLADATKYAQLSDQSAYVDFNNLHSYPRSAQIVEYVPSLANATLGQFKTIAPAKGLWLTETGLAHGDGRDPAVEVEEFTAAKLLLRFLLYAIAPTTVTTINSYPKFTGFGGMGAGRAYLYELLDDHHGYSSGRAIEDRHGLFNPDLSPKLTAHVLKNWCSLLADPGASFTPGSLDVTVSGITLNSFNQLAAQQSDGTMWWIIWEPAKVSDFQLGGGGQPRAGYDLYDAGVPISATFGQSWASISVYRPLVSASPIRQATGKKLNLTAYSDVQLVRVSPNRPKAAGAIGGLRSYLDSHSMSNK